MDFDFPCDILACSVRYLCKMLVQFVFCDSDFAKNAPGYKFVPVLTERRVDRFLRLCRRENDHYRRSLASGFFTVNCVESGLESGDVLNGKSIAFIENEHGKPAA
jgi:integrase